MAVVSFLLKGRMHLEPFMDEIAKQVIDPQTNVSIFERERAHEAISTQRYEAKKKIWDEKELKLGCLWVPVLIILLLFNMQEFLH